MVVWNFETADRLLSELVDNEPVPSLDDIIEWARLELETPFITPEVAALAVTAVAATTTAAAAPILQNNPIVFFVCVNGYLFFGHYKSTVLKFFFSPVNRLRRKYMTRNANYRYTCIPVYYFHEK